MFSFLSKTRPPSTSTLTIGILISGRGSNMEAIIQHTKKDPQKDITLVVVSDQKNAPGLKIARSHGIEAKYLAPGNFKTKLEGKYEQSYIRYLQQHGVQLICLAGFMRVIKIPFLKAFRGRIINIHPSLLPRYPGLNAHQRVLENKEKRTGCTVHVVTPGIDTGRILDQSGIEVHSDEDIKTLSKRVLKLEHERYWEVITKIHKADDPLFTLPLKY